MPSLFCGGIFSFRKSNNSKFRQLNIASVNLIPLNPVTERDWKQPSAGRVEFFKNYLLENHVTATVRKEMGQDIKAACGQLRNRNLTSL